MVGDVALKSSHPKLLAASKVCTYFKLNNDRVKDGIVRFCKYWNERCFTLEEYKDGL